MTKAAMDSFIPFNLPAIGKEEIDTLKSGWLTTGLKTARFEREFGDYVRAPYALAVNSATSGLHLALAALGIGPGDEVITTPLTFCSTVNTIIHTGQRRVRSHSRLFNISRALPPRWTDGRYPARYIAEVHVLGCFIKRLTLDISPLNGFLDHQGDTP